MRTRGNYFEEKNVRKGLVSCLLIIGLLLLQSCVSLAPKNLIPVRDYGRFSHIMTTLANDSPDLYLSEIGRVKYDQDEMPLWYIASLKAPENAPRVLIIGGIEGQSPQETEAILKSLDILVEHPTIWKDVNIDFLPMINPWGWRFDQMTNGAGVNIGDDFRDYKSQEAKVIRKFLSDKQYDLIILHQQRQDEMGFSLTLYSDFRDNADFLISIFRDYGLPIKTFLPENMTKKDFILLNGVVTQFGNKRKKPLAQKYSLGNYLRQITSGEVYAINVPHDDIEENNLNIFHRADNILIQLLASKRLSR